MIIGETHSAIPPRLAGPIGLELARGSLFQPETGVSVSLVEGMSEHIDGRANSRGSSPPCINNLFPVRPHVNSPLRKQRFFVIPSETKNLTLAHNEAMPTTVLTEAEAVPG